jgi:hypothetical protein
VSNDATVLYLEADDEVTSVVRRIRSSASERVILVAPGRSRALSSVVAIRLLGRAGEQAGRAVAIVGDALTRSLAAEAGLAAHATLDEARSGDAPPAVDQAPRAAISVVRGPATEDTAPTLAAAAAAPSPVPPPTTSAGPDDLTRASLPAAVVRRPAPEPGRRARRSSGGGSARGRALLLALALLVAGAVAVGAFVLPAATVTLRPALVDIGPVTYPIDAGDAERLTGEVEHTTTVVATGSYEDLEAASGTVVLFNWTFFPVRVPEGTFVAAGEQAFATQAEVVVPRGSLTGDGRIAAGDIAVEVVAAAAGPGGNVDAEAIDTVVNEGIDAQLRGFPENPERRVINPEATSGGADETGPEILQADVDAARATLRTALSEAIDEALPDDGGILVRPQEPAEPEIPGADDLVGRRDVAEAELTGTQAWEAWRVDPDAVEAAAIDRLETDPGLVPDGYAIVPDSTMVELATPTVIDGVLTADATVAASAAPVIDRDEVLAAIAGMTAAEAEAALAGIGDADVTLWPGWTSTVPGMAWRVDLRVEGAAPGASATPSDAP